jgi:molybdopterin-guanine dinucleotide biosynthesis protein A
VTGAVVLAGGRSRRFGRDKLAVALPDGRTVLEHAIEAVAAVAGVVAVVVHQDGEGLALPGATHVVPDPEPYGGPLVGLATGLATLSDDVVIVVGGDMPALVPAVLARMAERLRSDESIAAVRLELGDESPGMPPPLVPTLPCAVRRLPALEAARAALAENDRRLRGLFERLAVGVVSQVEWRADDPAGRTLLDVDRPEDLRSEALR